MHNSFYPSLTLPNEVHTHRRQVRAFVSPPFICPEGKDHCPKSHEERKQIKEWLFLAAVQGCLPCVQHCLEEIGPDFVQSDNSELTVMDWAQRGVDQAVDGAQEVVGYLTSEWHMDLPIAEPVDSSPIADSSIGLSRCEQLGAELYDVQQPPPPPQLVPSIDDVPFESIPLFTGDIPFEGGRHLGGSSRGNSESASDASPSARCATAHAYFTYASAVRL